MMEHLGGPETFERIEQRQRDYEQPGSRQYAILDGGVPAGWVGYWEREWRDERVFEAGWSVLAAHQGRGLASYATGALLARVEGEAERRAVHAFPSVDNTPSNAVCRRVGFELLGEVEFEYPKGSWLRCNDWRFTTG